MMRSSRKRFSYLVSSLLALTLSVSVTSSFAGQFTVPPANESIIGEVEYISAEQNDTPTTIAQRYNLGLNAVMAANPGLEPNTLLASGTTIKVSTEFLLPPLPRKGIIVNLPEMRIYYFPAGTDQVYTFPVGIGKIGKTIPITNTAITRKVTNPVWIPPADIRKYDNEVLGIDPPKVMPPGPDNPLGPYAIYLRVPTYLIHSTIYPESIGTRASFGCIRMNESDIKEFFPMVEAGTPVVIIDMPNKLAWSEDTLYLESHAPLEERSNMDAATLNGVVQMIEGNVSHKHLVLVNWQLVADLTANPDGLPHEIGVRVR